MKKLFIAALSILFLTSCGKSPEEKALQLFSDGVKAVERYAFDDAEAAFKEIGKTVPQSPLGFYGTGLIMEHRLLIFDALQVYLSLTENASSFAPAYAGAYRIYSFLNQPEDAVKMAAEYARLVPDDPEAHVIFAEALANIRQYGRAINELSTAIEKGGDSLALSFVKAKVYFQANKLDSADLALAVAQSADPQNAEYYDHAADYFEAAGLVDSAVVLGQKAVAAAPDDFAVMMKQFRRALRHHYFFEARQIINRLKAKNLSPKRVIAGLEFFYYQAKGDHTQTRHACDNFTRTNTETVTCYIYDMQARGYLKDILTFNSNYAAIAQLMAKKNHVQVFKEFMRYYIALLFADYFDDQDGLKQLEGVPAVYINRLEVRLRKAFCLFRIGNHEKYQEEMAVLKKYHTQDPDWLTGFADIYANRFVQQYDSAQTYYRRALEENPRYRPAFEHWVDMFRRLKQHRKAVNLFSAYSQFEKTFPELAVLKAICLVENNKIEQGVALFKESYPLIKGDLVRFREMNSLLERATKNDKRKELFALLAQVGQENADAVTLVASYDNDNGNFEQALQRAEHALKLEPTNIPASVQKARALYGLGKRQEAFDIFEDNLVKAEFNVDNNYYFSHLLASEKIDAKRAANLARRALFDANHDLKVWMNLCYVHYQSGRYDLCRGEATKASRKYKDEPEPYFYIGMAMYQEGKKEAKENLTKAIKLGLHGENLKIARETLKKL